MRNHLMSPISAIFHVKAHLFQQRAHVRTGQPAASFTSLKTIQNGIIAHCIRQVTPQVVSNFNRSDYQIFRGGYACICTGSLSSMQSKYLIAMIQTV